MANTKLPARLLDTSAIPALNVTGDLTVDTTTLKVDSTNNRVGIGIAAPDELLSLYKTAGTTLVQAAVHANSTVGFEIKKTNATTQTWRIVDGQTVNGVLEFYDVTNSATRMAIKGNGNVGIGTANPPSPLSIFGTGTNSPTASNAQQSYDNALFRINNFGNSSVGLSIGSTGSNVTHIQTSYNQGTTSPLVLNPFGGQVGIGTTNLGSGRNLTVAGGAISVTGQNLSHSASSMVLGQDSTAISQIRFYGADASTAGALQFTGSSSDGGVGGERMRIDSSGNVIIGYNATNAAVSSKLTNSGTLSINQPGRDNVGGHIFMTQSAAQNTWMTICAVHDAGATGMTFLMNATRTGDQNRHCTRLVRYAYNQNFTEITVSQQNTAVEYRVSSSNLQYRFTTGGPYSVTLTIMADG